MFGKPILFWLIESLNINKNTIIYIPYNKEYLHFRIEDLLHKSFSSINFKFLLLEKNTRGAAETLNIACFLVIICVCLDIAHYEIDSGFSFFLYKNKKKVIRVRWTIKSKL